MASSFLLLSLGRGNWSFTSQMHAHIPWALRNTTLFGRSWAFLSFLRIGTNHDTNYAKLKDKSRSVHVPIMKGNKKYIKWRGDETHCALNVVTWLSTTTYMNAHSMYMMKVALEHVTFTCEVIVFSSGFNALLQDLVPYLFISWYLSERRTVPYPTHSLSYPSHAYISYMTHPSKSQKRKTRRNNWLYDRMLLRCFIVKKLISKNRSTQLAKHPSSPLSSFDPLMFPVTHFFQQIWVRLCVSAIKNKKD